MVETSTHNVTVPNVLRTEWTCIDINEENFMTLMDSDGKTREDMDLSEGKFAKDSGCKVSRIDVPWVLLSWHTSRRL